ncbi:hypothetical protein PG997_006867 [Apiospora hydei]|uniref:Uncharacterized protein n=1 Tax=Apiospora hydei TaxID=1337664 RepID=A0ABR1WRW3_9PEZI
MLEKLKDEPKSSSVSKYDPAFAPSVTPTKKYEEEDDVKEPVKDEVMSAADLSFPSVRTPAATPTEKQATQTSRKRKELPESNWKPSSSSGMSPDDEKPLMKRAKKSHRGAAHL